MCMAEHKLTHLLEHFQHYFVSIFIVLIKNVIETKFVCMRHICIICNAHVLWLFQHENMDLIVAEGAAN